MWFRVVAVSAALASSSALLQDRCGDCWCAPDASGCPTNETGIVDSFDIEEANIMSTFSLTNSPSFLNLQTPDGADCFPFATTIGALNNFPESELPQCAIPESTDSTVCAFKYDPADTVCTGREYEILTYDTAEAAQEDGATITHGTACGVCSSAQDFSIRMKTLDTLEATGLVCGVIFTFGIARPDRFDDLVKCFTDLGFTTPCSTAWAHLAAANTIECAVPCTPKDGEAIKLNEEPPTCEYSDCLTCSGGFTADFDKIAGRVSWNSGFTERIIYPCGQFYPVQHDACVGTLERGEGDADPTPAPKESSAARIASRFVVGCCLSFIVSLVL